MLTLYHWEPNGSALKTLICLHEKGLEFESRFVDLLAFEQCDQEFLELNPNGQVPVLVHDGKVLIESQFINEYLDEVFAGMPLRPTTPELLWRMRVWGKFCGEVLAPAAGTLGCKAHLAPQLRDRKLEGALARVPLLERQRAWRMAADDAYDEGLLQDSKRKAGICVQRLEQRLAEHDFLTGDAFSLADIELFAWCNALDTLVPDIVNYERAPRTIGWLERLRKRRGVRKALAHSRSGTPERAFVPGPEHSRWG